MLHAEVKKYLEDLDKEKFTLETLHGESEFSGHIRNILGKQNNYEPNYWDIWEAATFDFSEDYSDEDTGWGTYYGPKLVLPDGKGGAREYPSISRIDERLLDYWTKRARKFQNPVLVSRYADLVIDFSPRILNKTADVEMFQKVIDSNIEICEHSLAIGLVCKKRIKRALSLSIRISDKMRIEKTKKAMVNLERRIATDDKPGLWGFAFRYLLLEFQRKSLCTEQEEKDLVKDMEERLQRIGKNRLCTEHAVTLLGDYYSTKQKDENNLMRVLSVLENMLKTDEYVNSAPLLKFGAYKQIQDTYGRYASSFPKAKEAEKRLLREIGQLDLDWEKSMKMISAEATIDNEEMDKDLKAIFGEFGERGLAGSLQMIVAKSFPLKKHQEELFQDLVREYPLQFYIPKNMISTDGIAIAKVESLEQEFRISATQGVQITSSVFRIAIDKFKERFSKQTIFDYFVASPIFQRESKDYMQKAIFSYWENDYLVSSHFFIPLIESSIRQLIKNIGGSVLRPNDVGGYDHVLLSQLLKKYEKEINHIFQSFNDDTVFYLKLVLTDRLGLNLRNDFAHGLVKEKFSKRETSDILFCLLGTMSFLREEQ